MKHEPIQDAWKTRIEVHAESDKLLAEGSRLCAEGDALHAKGRRLRAAGNNLYRDAVLEKHGPDVVINWATGGIETN
jgi:hypothetical protein